jgi:hypothetical protein
MAHRWPMLHAANHGPVLRFACVIVVHGFTRYARLILIHPPPASLPRTITRCIPNVFYVTVLYTTVKISYTT